MKRAQLLPLLILGVLMSPTSSTRGAELDQANATKQFEIVPCLLPARIRKLGNLVYPERRRLVEATALKCDLKGGEYTYYDRAAPENAIDFFSALAENGNSDAQVSLGDVYQYLFDEPRYEQAAHWYQQASDNGSKSGMLRLARLYEKGNGVEQDGLMATNLWREATGAGEELVLASELDAARTAADERIGRLTDELSNRNEEADSIRRQLDVARADIDERQQALGVAETELRSKERRLAELELAQTNTQELTNLRSQLAQQKRTIEDQRYDIASLEGNLGVQEAQLKANLRQVQLQNNRLQEELAAVSSKADEELEARFAQVVAELNTNREELGSRSRELAATNKRVSQLQTESAEIRRQLTASTGNAAATGRLTAALEAKNVELGGHESVIRSLETEVVRFRSLLEKNNLQNKRLQDELAAVSSKADAELGDALAELNSRGDELDGLRGELAGARSALQNSDSDYGELLAALEQARGDTQKNSRATRKLVDKLEAEQTQQLELLTEQHRQIASLEGKVSVTQSRAENLRQALDQQIHQKAEIEARFAQAEAELNTNREKLGSRSRELAATNKRVSQLQTESAEIRRQLTASTGNAVTTGQLTAALEAKNVELAKSESVIKSLKSDVDTLNSLLEKNRKQREQYVMRSPIERLPDTSKIRLPKNVKLGKYYALVVGNNNYKYLPVLKNARNDARAVQKILNDEYNFETQLLLDVTKKTFYEAAKELLEKVGENDLVLFYYAGHGFETKNDSYWLPIETEQDIASYERQGVSSDIVSRWIKAMPAKHVFIITDSCYSGRGIEATGGVKWNVQDLELALPFYLNNRSRTMLTSGGNRPVLDGDGEGGEHSVFTKELIGLLEENRGVLTGEALYAYLLQRVKSRAQGFNVNQSPKFGKIVKADHGSGQFVFLHRNMQG